MANFYLFFLHFPNGLGISESELAGFSSGCGFLRSDTIYSAIFSTAAMLGKLDKISAALLNSPPKLIVSSAFPFCWTSDMARPRLFFPLPKVDGYYRADSNSLISEEGIKFFGLAREIPRELMLSLPDLASLIATAHQAKDRATNEVIFFYRYRVIISDGWGFYFWAKIDDEELFDDVVDILRVLSKTGVGPHRSVGVGKFEFFWEEADDRFFEIFGEDGDQKFLLSLYMPADDEKIPNNCDVVLRRGWASYEGANVRAKRLSVLMISEGTVLDGTAHVGRFVEMKLENLGHPIYRFGYAFCAPLKVGKKG